MGYAVRGRCGHRIAIIRKAGEDDDGDRDYLLIVRACGLRGENRDHVLANQRRMEGVVHQCSRPGIQTIEFVYLGGAITADRDLSIELTRHLQRARACFQRYKMEIYDRPGVRLRLKVRLLKAEVVEALLYGCMTWSPNKPDYDRLRRVHHFMLLRCPGWRKRKRDDHTLSYADALAKTASEHRGDSAQTEDIVCGIRSTYGGGASATEGDVWGAFGG